jgi:hypothetical protein
MNTLRPFSPQEIAELGGTNAFFPSTWENALLSTESQVTCIEAMDTIPVKPEAFDLVALHHPVFKPAIRKSLEVGRTYIPVPLWTRMMNQLRPALDLTTSDFLDNPDIDPKPVIIKNFEPLARRFAVLLASR